MEKERSEESAKRFIYTSFFLFCLLESFGGCLIMEHDFVTI